MELKAFITIKQDIDRDAQKALFTDIALLKIEVTKYKILAKAQTIEEIRDKLSDISDYAKQKIARLRKHLKNNTSHIRVSWNVLFNGMTAFGDASLESRFLSKDNREYLLKKIKRSIREAKTKRRESKETSYLINNIRGMRQGKVWIDSGIYLRAYKSKLSAKVFDPKKPANRKNHVGVEIEFYIPDGASNKDFAEELAEAGLSSHVTLKDDASIRCEDSDSSHEIAIIDTEDKISETVAKVCSILANFNAEVNSSCGLHIHLDARRRSPELIFRRLLNAQKYLFQLVPKSRRENQYCRMASPKHSFESSERYYAINPSAYRKYKTIEVRLHSGTISAPKIQNWIELLLKVINHGVVKNKPTLTQWLRAIGCCKSLLTFYIERAKKFSDSWNEPEHRDLPEENSDSSCEHCGDDSGYCSDCERCHACDRRANQ